MVAIPMARIPRIVIKAAKKLLVIDLFVPILGFKMTAVFNIFDLYLNF